MVNKPKKIKDFVEYRKLSQTREDRLSRWLINEQQKDHNDTEKLKKEFINEIINNLGNDIKNSTDLSPKIIKRSFFYKLKQNISKLFDIL